jgi:hypothetical protein
MMTFTWRSASICNVACRTWMHQLSMSSTAPLFANSSFDCSSSMYRRSTVELYSLNSYEFMYGLLRRLGNAKTLMRVTITGHVFRQSGQSWEERSLLKWINHRHDRQGFLECQTNYRYFSITNADRWVYSSASNCRQASNCRHTPPNLTQVRIREYLKMETSIEHE